MSSSRAYLDVDIDWFEVLEQQIARMSDLGDVMCMGDCNARVADRMDCLIENDSKDCNVFFHDNLLDNSFIDTDFIVNDMYIKRKSQDKKVNGYGNKLLSFCYPYDLAILNGRAGDNKFKGDYTFINHQGIM